MLCRTPLISVVKTASLGDPYHGTMFWYLNRTMFGRILPQG